MNLLLEIGTEEIPHWMIPAALKQLAAFDLLGAEPHVDATPRRLVLRASGIPERTADQNQVIKGPPLSAGDKAAAGFAKKQGVELAAMEKVGDYYELRKTVPGRLAIDLLAESIPGAITSIQWPKTMYWTAKTGPRFIRPIRWIVALLDDQVIPFEIASVKSGTVTRGHRQLGSSSIPVTIANYETELRKNSVILSSHERRHKIEKESAALGAKLDTDLLETLTFITEFPTAIRGEFDAAFLELPAEVLTTVMRHHQKYFSVESAPGKLAPNFVAVMNTTGDPDGLVKHGNERVLKARFNDARFFWDVDQQKKLADRVEDLKKVTFQAKLGSYFEKTERTVALVKELGGSADAERAALLCKTDLTTEMVKEFTDLQGIVGGLYAKHQGESESVSRAIYDHYKPLSMDDSIPETREGQIVALSDKLDTLRCCFEIGMIPTGSKDPFGLRRATQGIVKVLVEGDTSVKLLDAIERAFEQPRPTGPALFSGTVTGPDGRKKEESALREFMLDRIKHYFKEVRGFPYDEVNAVAAAGYNDLSDFEDRLTAVHALRPTENFEPLATSLKRIANILSQANYRGEGQPLLEDHLQVDAERRLFHEIERVSAVAREHLPRGRYLPFLEAVAGARPAFDDFFKDVMVMDPDQAVRARRLELLSRVHLQFNAIADFSEIVTSGEQK